MKARRFAVVGDPVGHSRSPAMHAAAYRALGLPHTYEAIRATAAELAAVVARLRAGELDGVNVTAPHKVAVLQYVDAMDPSARVVGACNTLVRDGAGRIVAYDTDVPAIAEELRALGAGVDGTRDTAVVLGAGGAARAAVVACAQLLGVARVVVRARTDAAGACLELERALEAEGTPAMVVATPLSADAEVEARAACVVQATSAGMAGADAGEGVAGAVAWPAMPRDAAALELVYAPRETPFLRAARRHGLRAEGGLGVLARQGALAFELWLASTAPRRAMLAALDEPPTAPA